MVLLPVMLPKRVAIEAGQSCGDGNSQRLALSNSKGLMDGVMGPALSLQAEAEQHSTKGLVDCV